MYADTVTQSMQKPLMKRRRRKIQMDYNEEHGIVPQTIKKEIRDLIAVTKAVAKEEDKKSISTVSTNKSAKNSSKLTNARSRQCLTLNWQLRYVIWCWKSRRWGRWRELWNGYIGAYKNGTYDIELENIIQSLGSLDSKVENIHDIMKAFSNFLQRKMGKN